MGTQKSDFQATNLREAGVVRWPTAGRFVEGLTSEAETLVEPTESIFNVTVVVVRLWLNRSKNN
jgi:hypothetical protein